MRFYKMLTLTIICVLLSVPALAQKPNKETAPSLEELDKLQYNDFNKIEYFGIIGIIFQGSAEKIGLNRKELIDYTRLRFKNNFGNIPHKELTLEEMVHTFNDKTEAEKVGEISFIIWTVGDDYHITLHIRCTAGNFDRSDIWKKEVLGCGPKKTVQDVVKKTIDDTMEELAIDFFKARGEM